MKRQMSEILNNNEVKISNFFKNFDQVAFNDFLLSINFVYKIIGEIENGLRIQNISHPESSKKGDLIWISEHNDKTIELIERANASFIICSQDIDLSRVPFEDKIIILSSNPRASFAFLVTAIFNNNDETNGIHKSVILDSNCIVGKNISIGPYSQIGKCIIGVNVTIGSNVFIFDNCIIGNDVIIKSGSIIGCDGYGFVQDNSGKYFKFPHLGNVVIDDSVEIGANVCIDRGSIGSTRIGMGSKIDNLVHIGHNVDIGKNVLIAASSSIAGSTKVGDNTKIWIGSKIADKIVIGHSVNVGIGSVVISDIESNKKCFGNPARVISNNNK